MKVSLLILAAAVAQVEDCPEQSKHVFRSLPQSDIRAHFRSAPGEFQFSVEDGKFFRFRPESRMSARAWSDWQKKNDEHVKEAMRDAARELEKIGRTRRTLIDMNVVPGFAQGFQIEFGGPEPRVTLDIEDMPIRDALRKVFKAVKLEYSLEEDLPNEVRVTVKAANIRLSTALDMITEAGNVFWSRELKITADDPALKPHFHIARTAPKKNMLLIDPGAFGPKIYEFGSNRRVIGDGTSMQSLISVVVPDERSKVTCPHCKGKIVAYRPKASDRCDTCGHKVPAGAKVCPKDKTPRPAPPKPWKFCPLCGKEVKFEG